jgi:pyridoxal phosphate enzyme (YggS family)
VSDRRSDLASALFRVRERIAVAARSVGREPDAITLIVVTKTYPATDVDLLQTLGIGDVGENRVDELVSKAAATTPQIHWHFIGQLQTNKVKSLVGVRGLSSVHSVDRPRLVRALSGAAAGAGRESELNCFAQVDLAEAAERDPGRGGVDVARLPDLAEQIAQAPGLRLAGLMAVAPVGADPGPVFGRLADLGAALRRDHPGATALSAGMSGDFEEAIRHGATHVRVGAAVLGPRRSDE